MRNATNYNDSYLLIKTEVGIRGVVGITTTLYYE